MVIDTRQAAYTKAVETQLGMTRTKVTLLRRRIDKALAVGRIGGSEQLRIAMEQVEHHLGVAEVRVDELNRAGADASESHRPLVDDAFENLAQSIRKAVSRFP